MTVQGYPAYRMSGIPWAGDIPAAWTVAALKHVVTMKSGEQITAEDMQEGGSYPVFGGNGLRGFTSSYTHTGYFALIGRQGALCGNINYADGQFWASEHAVVVHQRQRFAVRWMGELLRSMDLGQYSITAAQPGLSVEAIGNLRIPIPPFVEQSAIAAFLDREAGKIDALVAEQERLIALLKEKHQAFLASIITVASESFQEIELGRVLKSIEQGWSPIAEDRCAEAGEWGVLKLSAVKKGDFFENQHKTLPFGMLPRPELVVIDGDVILTRANTPNLVGDSCIVRAVSRPLMLSDLMYRLRPDPEALDSEFLRSWLLSPQARSYIERDARGSSQSMVKISHRLIRQWRLPLPKLDVQNNIIKGGFSFRSER